jgi:hypothetical protein
MKIQGDFDSVNLSTGEKSRKIVGEGEVRTETVGPIPAAPDEQGALRDALFKWIVEHDLVFYRQTLRVPLVDSLMEFWQRWLATRNTSRGKERFIARDDVITAVHNYAKVSRAPEGGKEREYIGKDGRSHFRVTGGNCACGWTIINETEWVLHLEREGGKGGEK